MRTHAIPLSRLEPLASLLCTLALIWAFVGDSANVMAAEPVSAPLPPATRADLEFYESRVRPVLVRRCVSCHGPDKQEGGLRLDRRAGWAVGGDRGPLAAGGKPDESLLLRAVRHQPIPGGDELKMPPREKLPADELASIAEWVSRGLPGPNATTSASGDQSWDEVFAERSRWWSLQPIRSVAPPSDPDPDDSSAAVPIDRFIAASRQKHALPPAPRADDPTLARRLAFVITGLPPNPADVTASRHPDGTLDALALAERLLASPHFGERWARHWMDVVRYGDTYGYEWDIPAKGAWRYRDYLVRALNADVSFAQMVREQVAGDLLESPRINHLERINESALGPMFFQLGEKRHGDSAMFDGIHQEMLHNKIDAFGKAFQALTIGCAQCHDHKLDAVSQRDYYAVAGMFFSPRWTTRTVDLPNRDQATRTALFELKRRLREALARRWTTAAQDFAKQLVDSHAAPADGPHPWRRAQTAPNKTDLPLEHPLAVWSRIAKAATAGEDLGAIWKQSADQYRQQRAERLAANARDYRVVADFRREVPAGWSVDGIGLVDGPAAAGEYTVSMVGDAVVGGVLPAGLYTHRLSTRLNGLVQSPLVTSFAEPKLSLLVIGGDFAAERLVVDNAFLAERQTALGGDFVWKSFPTFAGDPGRPQIRSFIEIATKTSNANFPPRPGLGGMDPSREQIVDPRSWFGVVRAVAHSTAAPPADELARFERLFAPHDAIPTSLEEVADRYTQWLQGALLRWASNTADDDDAWLVDWLVRKQLLPNRTDDPTWSGLVAEYRAVEARVLEPWTVNSLADRDPGVDYRLNIRGQYDRPSDPVGRGYLTVFTPAQSALDAGTSSGRRALAELVASPQNPLTARVYVNRVWHWLFGAGLVATPDDFGHLGEAPSHPELLDYLACWFVEHNWSTKELIRFIVSSETFCQSSRPDPRALEIDPLNRLCHHYPLRRLEAESIRDSILAVSGRLDGQLYGPVIDPPRSNEDSQKRLFSGPLDGAGRRSLYIKSCIMEPARFFSTFNQPPPKLPTGRRDVTNVPAQALALMNDPFVIQQAEAWAERLVREPHESPRVRLTAMFEAALGRSPREAELARWEALVGDLSAQHSIPAAQVLAASSVWRDVAHALWNAKEFIYYR